MRTLTEKEGRVSTDIFKSYKLERLIASVAYTFNIPGCDFDDCMQLGRIAVSNLLKQHPITVDNLHDYSALIRVAVRHALINQVRKEKAQKRTTLNGARSLDRLINSDGNRTEHDRVGSDQRTPLEILLEGELDAPDLDSFKVNWGVIYREVERTSWREIILHVRNMSLQYKGLKTRALVVMLLVHALSLKQEEIVERLSYNSFVEYGLGGWLWIFFNNSPFRAINFAYPGVFLPYHMAKAPQGYWLGEDGKDRAAAALRAALESTGYSPEHYPKLLTETFFEECKLTTPLQKTFQHTRNDFLEYTFPGQYNAWEMNYTPRGFFDVKDNVHAAVRWLIEKRLDIPLSTMTKAEAWDQKITDFITKDVFSANELRVLMKKYGSPEPLLREVYPDKWYPWSFPGKTKWKGQKGLELAAQATRWLVEERLQGNPRSTKVRFQDFIDGGLHGLITSRVLGFNSSPKAAMKNAYPELDMDSL